MIDIAKLLYVHSCAGASGTVNVYSRSGTRRIELRRGWVHSLDAGPSAPARPEAQLRYIMRLKAPAEFHPESSMYAWKVVQPFHPAPSIRNHIEAQHVSPDQVRRHLGQSRIALGIIPHQSCIGWDEKPLISYMSQPHTLREIENAGICPPLRTIRLVVFLDTVGAFILYPSVHPMADAYAVLGVPPGASAEQIKSAYRRLARELHPDVHPHASQGERNALAARFATIHAAYRKLC